MDGIGHIDEVPDIGGGRVCVGEYECKHGRWIWIGLGDMACFSKRVECVGL